LKFEDEITKIDSLEDFDLEMRGKFKSSLDIKETNDWQILKDNGLAHKKRQQTILETILSTALCKKSFYNIMMKIWHQSISLFRH